MENLTHPALRGAAGSPREDVTVDEWATIIARLDEAIAAENNAPARVKLIQQRMDAVAAKNAAWKKREAALCALLSLSS